MSDYVPDLPQPLSDEPGQLSPTALEDSQAATAAVAFLASLKTKIAHYLLPRQDILEQRDHLSHVAARARWLYANERQQASPEAISALSPRDYDLLEACVLSHDMGKWIPRDELRTLFSKGHAQLDSIFRELNLSPNQTELFLLGIRRRFNLPTDGYTPEYDAAHHLVSAFILVTDPDLGFHALAAEDQAQLVRMVIGHQFGSYFKGSLLNLSLHDPEVTTGMLVDTARSDRLEGDLLSSVFHDADISDLLSVGTLENLDDGQEKFHSGGLVKILMLNFINLLYEAPQAPTTPRECLQSCQSTVNHACREFLTSTAVECGHIWREEARGFLDYLEGAAAQGAISAALTDPTGSVRERLARVRALVYGYAQDYLRESQRN